MKVWLTRSKGRCLPCVEVWLKKPKLQFGICGNVMFVSADKGFYEPDYVICMRVFRKLTNLSPEIGECLGVDLQLSLKPLIQTRKKATR